MANLFNSIKLTKPRRNKFNLTHDVKFSCNMGELIPVLCQEAVPGDKFTLGCESLVRFSPMIAPVMHRFDVYCHYFFVPNRICWDGWEYWISNQPRPLSGNNLPAFPYVTLNKTIYDSRRLCDYMGLPDPGDPALEQQINALPFMAYQKIYQEYYRDQNLIPVDLLHLVDGDNNIGSAGDTPLFTLRQRAWEHDYFTSALPFAQKGNIVDVPLGDVKLKPNYAANPQLIRTQTAGAASEDLQANVDGQLSNIPAAGQPRWLDPNGSLVVDSTTIEDLRRAMRLQEFFEKDARAGTRYIEKILGHFGVRSSDKRLQRPEYITGSKSPVVISEVLNTAGVQGDAVPQLPQGNMAGHGVSVNAGNYGKYYCEEHGYVIGIMSIMPKTAYQQGVPKHFLKTQSQYDYYWPEFAHIGEQPVLQKELFLNDPNREATFGYVPRYAEYKYAPSRVAGDFKTSLNHWHEGRIFANPPLLNQEFIECVPDTRIFAVTDTDTQHMWVQHLNKITAIRPMPVFGTPHF